MLPLMKKHEVVTPGLVVVVLLFQLYITFIHNRDADQLLVESDAAYQKAVFDSGENKGVMHQVFRQNEVDRELLKVLVRRCR